MILTNTIKCFSIFILFGCQTPSNNSNKFVESVGFTQTNVSPDPKPDKSIINYEGNSIKTRFNPPEGYERISVEPNSYYEYLRTLPLKPAGSLVTIYDGSTKPNHEVYDAVVDLEIGNKDLHQCADAIMRLRAEYLWKNKQYDQIHFNFTNGFRVDYTEWMKGKRISVKGNTTKWYNATSPSNTYTDFWSYMEIVFTYAGTLSLSKKLIPVSEDSIQIGDIFIYGGSPGHGVVIVDMVENKSTGEKLFLLAQSYMPAQEIQILKNPNDSLISPWYRFDSELLTTPEWRFRRPIPVQFE